MAIADTITSMQNHTSNAYTMIGYGTDLTGINKNLENLSTSIFNAFLEALRNPDTLFTNLPKKSGSGSVISLNDTANAPMRITLGASELTQAGTPTPSSPQDIHTISGSNTILVRGKNLLSNNFSDYNFTSGTYGFIQVSNITESMYIAIYDKDTTVDISGCYLGFSGNGINANDGVNWILDGHSTPINAKVGNRDYKYISIYPRNETTFNKIFSRFNVMVCKGSTPDTLPTFEPYTSQEEEVYLGGINLLNPKTLKDGYIQVDGLVNTAHTNEEMYSDFIKVKPNTTYTFKIYKSSWAGFTNNNWIGIGAYSSKSESSFIERGTMSVGTQNYVSWNLPATTQYVRISARGLASATEVMFNEGGVKDYKPYLEPIEYCKIGTYEDKFIRASGKNWFDLSNPQTQSSNTPKVQDDKIVASSPTAWSSIYFTFTGLSKNTTYYIKSKLAFTSGGGAYSQIFGGSALDQSKAIKTYMSSITTSGDYSTSFSTGDNDTITISFCTSGNSGIWTLSNIMLSSEDTEYEPYGSNEWYIKKNIGKVVLDGTEDWTENSGWNTSNPNTFHVRTTALSYTNRIYTDFLCNNFTTQLGRQGVLDGNLTYWESATNSTWYVFIDASKLSEVSEAGFKSWLSNNNMTCYYVLATPTYTKITGTLAEQLEQVYKNMLSQKEQTNISQVNNDLSFNMSVLAIEE